LVLSAALLVRKSAGERGQIYCSIRIVFEFLETTLDVNPTVILTASGLTVKNKDPLYFEQN
jgi:hypothetical protein